MSGVTKHIYDREIMDINIMWNSQLKKIEKVLPCTYNEDTIIDLLKKYYQEINTCIPMNEEQKDLLEVIQEIFG